jgi:hypothetical protein
MIGNVYLLSFDKKEVPMGQEEIDKDIMRNNPLEQRMEEYSKPEETAETTTDIVEESLKVPDVASEIETKIEVKTVTKNRKEMLYDKIPISIKALDIIIAIAISLLVIMIVYFVIRKYS